MLRFTILLFCMFVGQLHAQFKSNRLFSQQDSIVVEFSSKLGKVYTHKMQPKETVYSLAKAFGHKLTDLSVANPTVDLNKINVGQEINVPFLSDVLIKHASEIDPRNAFVPVYYKVRPKDNLFRISRVYFNQTIENLIALNDIKGMSVGVGQIIQVGWLQTSGTKTQAISNENQVLVSTPQKAIKTEEAVVSTSKPSPTLAKESNTADTKSTRTKETKQERSKRIKAKNNKKFLSKLKKSLGLKSKRKEIKDVVELSEQLEKTESSMTPEERKPVIEENLKKSDKNEASLKPEATQLPKEETNTSADRPVKVGTITSVPEKVVANDMHEEPIIEEPAIVFKREKGIAIWNQTSSDSKNLFALHPTAKVGSYIEITNPMMNKTVQAKVIGNIPPKTYTDDVSLVISPRVAKSLGVVDRRFMVKIKYREE